MNTKMYTLLAKKVHQGLTRSALTTVSAWSELYRVMGKPFPGPWTFTHHPWAKAMCDSTHQMTIGQKAAQMAYSEVALNRTFKAMDIDGESVLYVLPNTKPDASVFSSSRFDVALELSPHLRDFFSSVRNVDHKRAGSASLYIRGSRSRSQLKSIPCAGIVFDEVDEMVQKNIILALERASGQREEDIWFYLVSTPTVEGIGINGFFEDSTQDSFFFRCPHCLRMIDLPFGTEDIGGVLRVTAESLIDPRINDSYIVCPRCDHILDHYDKINFMNEKNEWVSAYKDRMTRGFYINQLYSMMLHPRRLAESYLRSLTNASDEQEYFNSKGGLPHVVKGARITDADIISCLGNYPTQKSASPSLTTMGIDVGKWLHFEVDQWHLNPAATSTNDVNLIANPRCLRNGKVRHFHELDALMYDYNINQAIIDVEPETRKSIEFCNRFKGIAKMCRYARGVVGKTIQNHPTYVHVDRTAWLDLSLGRFSRQTIQLPRDINEETKRHLKALIRVYKEDKDGNQIGAYVKKENEPDHAAHARNYSEIALSLATNMGGITNYSGAE